MNAVFTFSSILIADLCTTSLVLISALIIFYQYVYHYIEIKKKPNKPFLYSALISSICTILALITTIIIAIFKCLQIKYENYITLIFFTLYGFEHYCLSLSLFINLHYLFRESVIAINSRTKRIFIVVFTCQPVVIISAAISETKFRGKLIWYFIFGLNYGLLIVVCISIVILYIYKLVIVYTLFMKNATLIKLITKTFILAVTSIIFSLLTVILMLYEYGTNTDIFYVHTITSIDILTNFLCIMLGFQYFESYYNKLCGLCIHKKCERCWSGVVTKRLEIEKQIDNNRDKNNGSTNLTITDDKGSTVALSLQQNTLSLQQNSLSLTIVSSNRSNPSVAHSPNLIAISEEVETDIKELTLDSAKSSLQIPKLSLKKGTLSLSLIIPNSTSNNIKKSETSPPDPEISPNINGENRPYESPNIEQIEGVDIGCNSVEALHYDDIANMKGMIFVQ